MAQNAEENLNEVYHVLPDKMGGGPHGLGKASFLVFTKGDSHDMLSHADNVVFFNIAHWGMTSVSVSQCVIQSRMQRCSILPDKYGVLCRFLDGIKAVLFLSLSAMYEPKAYRVIDIAVACWYQARTTWTSLNSGASLNLGPAGISGPAPNSGHMEGNDHSWKFANVLVWRWRKLGHKTPSSAWLIPHIFF